MNKISKTIGMAILLSVVFVLSGCGEKVEIAPAHVGKVLGKNGFAPDIIPPSKFRLEWCWAYCDKLITLETSDKGFKETMKLFMPKDKLNIDVEVRGTLSIASDKKTVNSLYDRVPPSESATNMSHGTIRIATVYNTYGEQAIRGIVRSELVKYSIADILLNRESIGASIHLAINEKLQASNTPLVVSRFELADVQPPEVIVKAQEAAKERDIAVQTAEANARVKMVEAERALDVAKKERLVAKEKALAIAEQNEIAADSITPELLKYRQLEVSERVMLAAFASGNENIIVVPTNMEFLNTASDSAVLGKVLGKTIQSSK